MFESKKNAFNNTDSLPFAKEIQDQVYNDPAGLMNSYKTAIDDFVRSEIATGSDSTDVIKMLTPGRQSLDRRPVHLRELESAVLYVVGKLNFSRLREAYILESFRSMRDDAPSSTI